MTKKINPPRLSKSKFTAGCQCLKRLYFQINPPEGFEIVIDAQKQAIFDQGHAVGALARECFKGGVLVAEKHDEHAKAEATTRALMDDPSVSAIYEAAYSFENIAIRADIMVREGKDRWTLVEVKSTTSLKDYHYWDIGIQTYVLNGLKVKVSGSSMMYLNKEYIYKGGEYDLDRLFTKVDVSEDVEALDEDILKQLAAERAVLLKNTPPSIAPGDQCTDPYECEFCGLCIKPEPIDSVGNLPRITAKKKEEFIAAGITSIKDIPDGYPLSGSQQNAVASVKTGKLIMTTGLEEELKGLKYPRYYMDFETSNPALPRHKGMWPYSAIPFQWSVHVHKSARAKIAHHAFLAPDAKDPREDFLVQLLDVLGDEGPIIVYSKSFEGTRLNELADWFPKYKAKIQAVQDRFWDLLAAVRSYVYHPKFEGSYSLKAVLPALLPDLGYQDLDIAQGGDASLAYEQLVKGDLSATEQNKIRENLLKYCERDTYAMYALVCHLSNG